MKQAGIISPNFPRVLGSVLVSLTLATQTLPSAAQQTATNPPQEPAPTAPNGGPAPTPAPSGAATSQPGGDAPAAPPSVGSAAGDSATSGDSAASGDSIAGGSAAPADPEAAAAALSEGKTAYQNGDYATAAQQFERANQLSASAEAQYWLAMALDLQGRADEAVTAFDKLFANPEHQQLDAQLLEPAQRRYELLKKIPATVLLHVVPADATVEVDGNVLAGGAPHTLKLAAGAHVIKVSRDGFAPAESRLEVQAAQSLEHSLELEAAPAPVTAPEPVAAEPEPTEPPPPAEPRSMVPAYVTLGVAGASAVVGTIFGVQALGAKGDFEDNPTASNADAVERNALIADMAWGVALTLGITGVVLLTSDEPVETEQSAKSKLLVAPFVSREGGGAAARMTF